MDGQPHGCGPDGCLSRRAVLATGAGVAAALLGGCATYGGSEPVAEEPPVEEPPSATGAAPTRAASPTQAGQAADPAPGGGGFARTGDIPVGGGKIIDAEDLVVTQPSAGTFKAFSAICTHAGCRVSSVENGTINCDCHGSRFRVADGTVANGPATRRLAAKKIKVTGDDIALA
jgi:Rieske Fe-S protein